MKTLAAADAGPISRTFVSQGLKLHYVDWGNDGAYLSPYHVLDFADLIDALGHEQVNIVAHSFAANVCTRYAGIFPGRVRKLVVVDGLGPTTEVLALGRGRPGQAHARVDR
jgi:pimeloyl-ACP methyl ester carboxylesterase